MVMRNGQIAQGCAQFELGVVAIALDGVDGELAAKRHVLNSGKAYGGRMLLSNNGTLRENPLAKGEIPALAQHDHGGIVGAWTDVQIVDGKVTAGGIRWANSEKVPKAAEYQSLWEDNLVSGISIGFRGRWLWRADLPSDHAAYNEDGGWYIDDWEVYEASLVAVGADSDSHRAFAMPELAPEPEPAVVVTPEPVNVGALVEAAVAAAVAPLVLRIEANEAALAAREEPATPPGPRLLTDLGFR